ncbi:TIGR00341 family protein [Demequina sp. SYSU T00039]|uniref:TIGR00341 family protein n=1 Tax=Demequina lignilytica TaxID=3051663 RepID=A0AAW7MA37_9MICO|nr:MULTISPECIES: TIGR00341 family protein [unclassified Demequina]MDN4479132.1 TIGR00341 family protein [Demequina sp. SYSU T00039-1]MDN4489155.1 TIGR00341 family protein [Demequina sp. SYSU T00039]MDN4490258.1 TIGR00341 family protein [Demequina sp. SYSU T00068]
MTAASTPRETRWGAKLNTVDYMRDAVFFDGPTVRSQTTRFWLLLLLASAIASAGVIANSTATVIGAMIVAPLMRPIQGTMLATVLGDHRNLMKSVGMMVAGVAAAIGVGFVMGLLMVQPIVAETNAQVAGRVSPGLIDLVAALATGLVGSVALLRSDISDTLPGVAIAISLVPPLCVVGLTLESGAYAQSVGALLLFVTNVAAILATGSVTMAVYGFAKVRIEMAEDKEAERRRRARAYLTTMVMLLIVAVPLTYSSLKALEDTSRIGRITTYIEDITEGTRWEIVSVALRENDRLHVIVKGQPPLPDMAPVYADMEANGLDTSLITIELVPTYTYDADHLEAPETVG